MTFELQINLLIGQLEANSLLDANNFAFRWVTAFWIGSFKKRPLSCFG